MMLPIDKRFVRLVAYVGIVVCASFTIIYGSAGEWKDAGAFLFVTAANVITLIMYRRTK